MFLVYEVHLTQWSTEVIAYGIFPDLAAAVEYCREQGESITLFDHAEDGDYWGVEVKKEGMIEPLYLRIKHLPYGGDVPPVDDAFNLLYQQDEATYEG